LSTSQRKKSRIVNYLNQNFLNSKTILLLQEHHLSPNEIEDLPATLNCDIFSTTHLLTLVPPSILSTLSDPITSSCTSEGRQLYLKLRLTGLPPLEVANIYVPSKDSDRLEFFQHSTFLHTPHHITIYAGDLNDCPNSQVDRKNQGSRGNYWEDFKKKWTVKFIDTVRSRHPSRQLFTRPQVRNGVVSSWSRIDHILLTEQHKSYLRDAHIKFNAPCSDHRPVVAVLNIPSNDEQVVSLPTTNQLVQRINPSLFQDSEFSTAFENFYSNSLRPSLEHLPPDIRWQASKQKISTFAAQHAFQQNRNRRREQERLEHQLASLEEKSTLDSTSKDLWTSTHSQLQQLEQERTKTLYLRSKQPYYANASSNAQVLHQRLKARQKSSTFSSLKLADGTTTTDLSTALTLAHDKFSTHYTPSTRSPSEVENARSHFLDFIRSTDATSDPPFARCWDSAASAELDKPITVEEVKQAIKSSPSSSSPGLLGLPYEFYKQSINTLSSDLAAAFNSAWDRGKLSPSQTEARVRLLFKHTKPNADPTRLDHYRPISLRETDYRLLARIVVARMNPLLVNSIPRGQVGFVPERDSSEAGFHLQLLIEEILRLCFPEAALVSLDQESAYNLVDHEWILACYEAFGASPRFLHLLSAI